MRCQYYEHQPITSLHYLHPREYELTRLLALPHQEVSVISQKLLSVPPDGEEVKINH